MTFLVDFGIKSGLALGVAFLVAFALRRSSASVRYAVWTCALAAVLVLPLASWIVPRWNIDRSAWRRATGSYRVQQAQPSISVVMLLGFARRRTGPFPGTNPSHDVLIVDRAERPSEN